VGKGDSLLFLLSPKYSSVSMSSGTDAVIILENTLTTNNHHTKCNMKLLMGIMDMCKKVKNYTLV